MLKRLRLLFDKNKKSNVEKLELEVKQLEIKNLKTDLELKNCKIRVINMSFRLFFIKEPIRKPHCSAVGMNNRFLFFVLI